MSDGDGLQDKAALVVGGSRGIGRAVARALAAAGARVVVNGREAAAADAVVAEIRAAGGEAEACAGSAADFSVAGRLVACCLERFGALDALIHCAGIAEPPNSSILDVAPEDFRTLIDAHLTSCFNVCRVAAPRMAAQRAGSIVTTSSHAALGIYGGSGYPAAKAGTEGLTRAIAAELREYSVRANAVCPGARTRLSTGTDYERHIERLHARGLLSDVVRNASLDPAGPEHAAPLYRFLAGARSRHISGRTFSVAGGYVGLFAAQSEQLLVYRDHRSAGPWPADELAAKLLAHPALARPNPPAG